MKTNIKIWIALVCAVILSACALYAITHFLPTKHIVQDNYNVWYLLGTFGGEACPYPAPPHHSIRFFISFWWFFVITITACYSGTLTYFMSYPGRRPATDTVPKLQNALISKSLYYGTLKGTAYASFLMTDMAKVHPIFRDSLVENPENLVNDGMTGMNLVLKGKYAFVYIKMILKWFTAIMGQDRFFLSKDVFSTDYIGAAIQKCHPCKKSFDHIISRLEETGFFTKWYDDAFTKATILAPHVNVGGARALSIDDLQGAFYFLGMGAGIAFISLLMELLVKCLQGKKIKKKIRKPKKKTKQHQKIYPVILLQLQSKSKLGQIQKSSI